MTRLPNAVGPVSNTAACLIPSLLIASATLTCACSKPVEVKGESPRVSPAGLSQAELELAVRGVNQFGLGILRGSGERNNAFCSPITIALGLAIPYAGAKGETATELGRALHGSMARGAFEKAMNRLSSELVNRNRAAVRSGDAEKKVEIHSARALWAQRGAKFEKNYLDSLSGNYGVGVRLVDFAEQPKQTAREINDFVSDGTRGKIKELVSADTLSPQAQLLVTSSLYLDANWKDEFSAGGTHPAKFTGLGGEPRNVNMMHRPGSYRYLARGELQAVELPYFGEQLSMLLILPEPGRFESVRAALAAELIEDVRRNLREEVLLLGLPKFELRLGSRSLRSALESLGVRRAFEQGADFTGITQKPLNISQVVEQVYVAVDERGTQAASAVALEMAAASAPPEKVVEFNRPFFSFIVDTTGVLLFAGQVTEP
ncbi:MAG TPA: serpin family protein [Polyangiaceae bacterium]|nr:serpin family protein [Polyangiaceae bacterium]